MSQDEFIIETHPTNARAMLTISDPLFVCMLKNELSEGSTLHITINKSTYDKMVENVLKKFISEHFKENKT